MYGYEHPLSINMETTIQDVAAGIEAARIKLKRDGVILGLSGGLDSTVVAYLCAQQIDRGKIHLMYLPEKDSKKEHRQDAALVSKELGVPLQVRQISRILKSSGTYGLLPLGWAPGRKFKAWLIEKGKGLENLKDGDILTGRLHPKPGSWVAKGNAYIQAKHRARMLVLYQEANLHNLMVVGAANKTEWLTGTFVQWGCDHCADFMPILHLYRSQVAIMAAALGIPKRIREKMADPDVIPGLNDKEQFLGSFRDVDLVLWGLEGGQSIEDLLEAYDGNLVRRVVALYEGSKYMRETPYWFGKYMEAN
jgi:NAD+ synthase